MKYFIHVFPRVGGNIITVPYGPERDVLFFFQTLAIFALAYATFKMSQRSRETGFFSATTGLCILLIGITCLQVTIFHALFFAEDTDVRQSVLLVGDIVIMGGLVFLIIFVEIDQEGGIPMTPRPARPYRYTKLALVILVVLIPLVIFVSELRFLLFFLEIFPAAFAARGFIRRFSDMEMVKRTDAPRQFLFGLILAGLSNFLPAFHLIFSFWIFGITSAVIVVGAFLMTSSWAHFPRLEDLQWMRNLDRLIVFESQGGLPLFEHTFHSIAKTSINTTSSPTPGLSAPPEIHQNVNIALAAGAMTGIDSLLGEVLASKGHIKEIDYGEKKAIFYRGKQAIFMLVVAAPSQELLFRLEMFGLSFERQFAEDFAISKTDQPRFQGAETLMWKHFS